jgi:hypothetical protein
MTSQSHVMADSSDEIKCKVIFHEAVSGTAGMSEATA